MAAQRGRFGLEVKESSPLLRGAAVRGTSASTRPRTAAWFAQMLVMLSGYLNNKMRPVKAYLHFCSHVESEGYG